MIDGFVPIHRKIIHWEWYSCPKTKAVFLDLLLFAAHVDSAWRGVPVKRGQVITSNEQLALRNGISVKSVRCALERLRKTGEIECQGANRYTKITLCQYDTYRLIPVAKGQAEGKREGKPRAIKGQAEGNIRNDNNEETEETLPVGRDFDAFWSAYPRKKSKAAARRAFLKLSKAGALPPVDELIEAIRQQSRGADWLKDGGQFIPHPATWLNAEKWEDQVDAPTRAGGPGKFGPYGVGGSGDDIAAKYGS